MFTFAVVAVGANPPLDVAVSKIYGESSLRIATYWGHTQEAVWDGLLAKQGL
jgi:hypothetical protein